MTISNHDYRLKQHVNNILWLSVILSKDSALTNLRYLEKVGPKNSYEWESLVKLATELKLLPAIFPALEKLNRLSCLDDELRYALEMSHLQSGKRNKIFLDRVIEITKILKKESIEVVLLKGIAGLVKDLFPTFGSRFLSDIDIYVDPENNDRAAKILRDAGMVWAQLPVHMGCPHHPYILCQPGEPGWVELHLALPGAPKCTQVGQGFYSIETLNYQGAELKVLNPAAHFAVSILHAKVHHIGQAMKLFQFRNIVGFNYDSADPQLDWNALEEYFSSIDQRRLLKSVLKQTHLLLNAPTSHRIVGTGLSFPGKARILVTFWILLEQLVSPYKRYALYLNRTIRQNHPVKVPVEIARSLFRIVCRSIAAAVPLETSLTNKIRAK